ncbi:oocyte zinc finger protein XlCOF6-like isoform X1 [Euwallacea similis]|uniref:oocyte zinc finger protein XlCOF6-like isoform X1 n=1 Tax=Euwallacea similis TaxID=1736056 RepID=UPI00344DA02F
MKTEHLPEGPQAASGGDPIWTSNVELLASEECLPIIGSCQASSILQNLDSSHNEANAGNLQNMYLIILHGSDYKLPLESPLNLHNNSYIVLKDSVAIEQGSECNKPPLVDGKTLEDSKNVKPNDLSLNILETSNSSHTSSVSPKHYDKESFEDMLYFVCNLCPFLCTKETKITEHLESVHKNKTSSKLVQLKCPACANIFYHRASLKSHLMHDHCVASNDLNLIVQAVIFYSNKENKKEDLGKKGKVDFEGHKPIETIQKVPQKVPLPQVAITPNNSEKLITNLMKKSDPIVKYINSQKCPYGSCKVLLGDPKKMDFHVQSHLEEGFKCIECQEKFLLWKPLTSHLWLLHKIDMELFACDKCDYKTNSLSKLNTVHKLIHSTVKAYQCDTCQKGFKNQKQLRNHKRIHREVTDKAVEKCELCSKTFSEKRRLKYHMDSVHKKLKPYLCNFCGYKGSCRASLKMHIRSHTGEKPFSCDQCQYSTTDHNSLRRHKLRHTGQKPYKCSYCPYACIQSSTYKAHLKTKHPGMEKGLMFTCFMCTFRTVNREMYNSHLVTVHKQKPPVTNAS